MTMTTARTVLSAALLMMFWWALAGQTGASLAAADPPYFVYTSGDAPNGGDNIRCFHFDPTTAALTPATASAGGNGPGYLAWSPDRRFVYAINSSATGITGGAVASFRCDPLTGALARQSIVSSGGSGPAHLCVHPSGKWLYVANYSSGHVASCAIATDGTLGNPVSAPAPVVTIPPTVHINAHMVLTNAVGTRLYVPCLGSNTIAVYNIDAMGVLTNHSVVTLPAGSGPRHMTFDHDETHAYVINELDNTMATLSHDPVSGALTWLPPSVSTLPDGYSDPSKCAHVLIGKDGLTLYGSNRRKNWVGTSSIVSFRIINSDGVLRFPAMGHETATGEIEHPRDFAIDPTGQVLLVASRGDDDHSPLQAGDNQPKWLHVFRIAQTDSGAIVRGQLITPAKVPLPIRPNFVGVMSKAPVANQAPTVRTAATGTPSIVFADNGSTLSVLGTDDLPESTLTYTWATTGVVPAPVTFSVNGTNAAKSSRATFTKAGTYKFSATITDLGALSVISNVVTVQVNQTATAVMVTPTSVTVSATATAQFSASAKDQFGVPMVVAPVFAWSVNGGGTISPTSGLFSAVAVGSFTVTADVGGKLGFASVTVTSDVRPTVAAAAAAVSPVVGVTSALSVLGADNGGEGALTYSWATVGALPAAVTFSVNGTHAAKASTATFTKAGLYTLRATIKDASNLTEISDVSVTVNATPTTVVITPASATLATSATLTFGASAKDQFGLALPTQPTFTWTTGGGGTVTNAGEFTAPVSAAPCTVTVSDGTRNDTAAVTIVAAGVVPPASSGGGGGGGCGLGAGLASLIAGILLMLRLGNGIALGSRK